MSKIAKLTKIYNELMSIAAKKDGDSAFPNEKFIHYFKGKKPAVFGVENDGIIEVKKGDLLIKGDKCLWKMFTY